MATITRASSTSRYTMVWGKLFGYTRRVPCRYGLPILGMDSASRISVWTWAMNRSPNPGLCAS
jgi:hypothetical protein